RSRPAHDASRIVVAGLMAWADEPAWPPVSERLLAVGSAQHRYATQVRADAAHDQKLGFDCTMLAIDVRGVYVIGIGRLVEHERVGFRERREHLFRPPRHDHR